jgi:hypothetical protein
MRTGPGKPTANGYGMPDNRGIRFVKAVTSASNLLSKCALDEGSRRQYVPLETDCVAMDYRPIHRANDTMAHAKGQRILAAFTDEALGSLLPVFGSTLWDHSALSARPARSVSGSKKLCGLLAFLACAVGLQRAGGCSRLANAVSHASRWSGPARAKSDRPGSVRPDNNWPQRPEGPGPLRDQ